ncbi:MAG: hypothetical protein HYR94_29430 [Chloroflexi bacterium]|nr:hypothetical protein [Chloroflexota bacterium]
MMGLTLLLIAGVAWPLNNLNSTRIETGPTASFALADPFPVTDLTGSNVTVQMSASNFKRGSWTPCKTENVAPASTVNVEPEAGHVSLISQ